MLSVVGLCVKSLEYLTQDTQKMNEIQCNVSHCTCAVEGRYVILDNI